MCGISGIVFSNQDATLAIQAMLQKQHHRGPDAQATWSNKGGTVHFAHNRLSILDLSSAGTQPMQDATGRYSIVFNGEVYNYKEIKRELVNKYTFISGTDTEVVLYALIEWGQKALNRFIGMFSIALWDEKTETFFAARDRLGIKPFYYSILNGAFCFASEIKALHVAGVERSPNQSVWATYLSNGSYGFVDQTFWSGVHQLPASHCLTLNNGGKPVISRYYSLEEVAGNDFDPRSLEQVQDEYIALLEESIALRFRSDVPVGINISGGLDSSALLYFVNKYQGPEASVKAFSFYTGDDRYDELPWVKQMIDQTNHELVPCLLEAHEIPDLAEKVQYHQDEPFGGIPTVAYAKLFQVAREHGVIVLLDGQGMDEQWAGYDYYRKAGTQLSTPTLQGTSTSPVRPQCLTSEFAQKLELETYPSPFHDHLRNLQYRDTFYTKIPRALRFNDRISMMSSTELREPFLDHRLFEIAFRQSIDKKIVGEQGKYFMRHLLNNRLPGAVVEAPKRALQTPQREWIAGPLKDWTIANIESAIEKNAWFDNKLVMEQTNAYMKGDTDNSFFIWQWLSLGLLS